MMTLFRKIAHKFFSLQHKAKRLKYRLLSDAAVEGRFYDAHPTLISGKGTVRFGEGVIVGYHEAEGFLTGYSLLNVRNGGCIIIGNRVHINNNAVISADRSSITIGDDTLIGSGVSITCSDYHSIDPAKRRSPGEYSTADVNIGRNVWIGSRATILKGVSIGDDSIVGAASVVTRDIPSGEIWGGVPARFIRKIESVDDKHHQ